MTEKNDHTFQFLNVAEAEQIVRELGQALDSDRKRTDKFRAMLICRTKPKSSSLNAGFHKKTVFGRWYYDQVNSKLRDHPGFAVVGKNNEQMNTLAHGLACAIRDDAEIKTRQYNAYVKSVDLFRSSLRALLSEAWDFLRYADPLTGVMTRGAMKIYLEGEQERSRRSGETSCVAMMDLDNFKKVNDTYGHQAGDQVLVTIAKYVQEHLRRYDQVFRYGGEEFVIMLPNITTHSAKTAIDRLRENINLLDINIGGNETLQVSASFGVAQLLSDRPATDSIEYADQALYEAKKAGRNRVRIWQ